MADTDYADDLALLAYTPAQAESQLHSLEQTEGGMSFKQEVAISCLSGQPLKLVDQFPYLCFDVSFTESNIKICRGKALTVTNRLLIKWKSVE